MNITWSANLSSVSKGSKLFEPFDMKLYETKLKEFYDLPSTEKAKYKGADDYVVKNGGPQLCLLNYNYKKIYEETSKRLENGSVPEVLLIDFYMQNKLIDDLLCSLENEKHIREIYPKKKLMVKGNGGINTSEATILMECIRQGRSLLQAGKDADMLAKPLIHFYAASAYAYAIIVINSPLHKSIDSLRGSHGHVYNHKQSTIDFGGDTPCGTFIDLLGAIPVVHVKNNNIDLKYPLLTSIDLIQNNNISLSLLSLLSMVPELSKFYSLYDKDHQSVHKLNIDTGIVNKNVTYNFYIGDGINKPNLDKLKNAFKTENIVENQGNFIVSVSEIDKINATIYQDIKGDLWYVESPINDLVLPEISLHFLIISALCNIMRYSPHEWNEILNNKVSSQFSLLVSEYIRLFEQKFPMLAVQYLTNYIPVLNISGQ